jgi:hypothetical protein
VASAGAASSRAQRSTPGRAVPRPESTNRVPDGKANAQGRTTALIGVGVAAMLGIGTWFALSSATDAGLARLARIDRVRAACDSAWALAATERDTAAVDRLSLPDTIDQGSSAELSRCGNLRPAGLPSKLPNQRDMTGERPPGGPR